MDRLSYRNCRFESNDATWGEEDEQEEEEEKKQEQEQDLLTS